MILFGEEIKDEPPLKPPIEKVIKNEV